MSNEFLSPWENVAADVFEDSRENDLLDPQQPVTNFCRNCWLRKKSFERAAFTLNDPIN